jgi:hypothetical protein
MGARFSSCGWNAGRAGGWRRHTKRVVVPPDRALVRARFQNACKPESLSPSQPGAVSVELAQGVREGVAGEGSWPLYLQRYADLLAA